MVAEQMIRYWLALFLIVSFPIVAEEDSFSDDWGDDWSDAPAYQLSHEISYGYSLLLDDAVNNNKEVLNELRSLSQLVYKADSFTFNFDVEVFLDQLTGSNRLNLDQMNFLIPFSNGRDLKVGRQVITWGTGDMLFLNDLFAKSWLSFFNGRDDGDLKPTIDAVRFSQYGENFNYEIAILPKFKADETPTGERYSFYLPGYGLIQPQTKLAAIEENDPEIFARLFANSEGVEWAVYAYSGFFKSPNPINQLGQLGFSPMTSFGASLRMPLVEGLFNAEIVYYQSTDDRSGVDPFVQNSQYRFLLGFEKELVSNVTLATQVYLEKTLDYQSLLENLSAGQFVAEENKTMVTFRLTHLAFQQKLMNSVMLFMSPSDDDHYIRYSSRYKLTDHWKMAVGLNWLNGEREETFLAQMQKNSNIFFRVHYSFE
jgi:hypothetical protein